MYYFCLEFDNPIRVCILKKEIDDKNRSKYSVLDEEYLDKFQIKIEEEIIFMSIARENSLHLFINDVLCCEAIDSSYRSGKIGIRSDNVRIRLRIEWKNL